MSDAPPPAPPCPVCGRVMDEHHMLYPPTMDGRIKVIGWRWICVQHDGRGNGHSITITQRKDEE